MTGVMTQHSQVSVAAEAGTAAPIDLERRVFVDIGIRIVQTGAREHEDLVRRNGVNHLRGTRQDVSSEGLPWCFAGRDDGTKGLRLRIGEVLQEISTRGKNGGDTKEFLIHDSTPYVRGLQKDRQVYPTLTSR